MDIDEEEAMSFLSSHSMILKAASQELVPERRKGEPT